MSHSLSVNFWDRLPKTFLVLAPMEDVTDTVFRQIVSRCGKPDVMFTEFTNCEGAQSVGQAKVVKRLKYTEKERPLVAQIWGISPEDYYKTAILIKELGFDGIDINMGCPVKKIIKQGACSALIKNPNLALEIVQATKEGAQSLPLSIKTRIGFNTIETESWIGFLLEKCSPAALTIHGRTVKEGSRVPCHWDEIAKVVTINQRLGGKTKIIGNGDVKTRQQALELADLYDLDGIMIGRGIFENLWLFGPNAKEEVTFATKLNTLMVHLDLFETTWGETKNLNVLKKYFKIYVNGYFGAVEFRSELMNAKDLKQIKKLVKAELDKHA
jgi:nifR3 family TIM-barrel protein